MIPANIDYIAVIKDLNAWGIVDYKIEAICGLAEGHISHMKKGKWNDMAYQRAARLYNLWFDELQRRAPLENSQALALST